MLIKKRTGIELPSSEITPEHSYLTRRRFMKRSGGYVGSSAAGSLPAWSG